MAATDETAPRAASNAAFTSVRARASSEAAAAPWNTTPEATGGGRATATGAMGSAIGAAAAGGSTAVRAWNGGALMALSGNGDSDTAGAGALLATGGGATGATVVAGVWEAGAAAGAACPFAVAAGGALTCPLLLLCGICAGLVYPCLPWPFWFSLFALATLPFCCG